MVQRIGIRELQGRLAATLRRVRDGETFEVTYHGQPVALLTPLPEPDEALDQLVARREARRPSAWQRLNLNELRPRAGAGPMTATQALADDRNAE